MNIAAYGSFIVESSGAPLRGFLTTVGTVFVVEDEHGNKYQPACFACDDSGKPLMFQDDNAALASPRSKIRVEALKWGGR